MSKHTPGPLSVGIWNDGMLLHHAVFPEKKDEAICLTGLVGEGGTEEERSIADAILYAAAPDMLHALELALSDMDETGGSLAHEHYEQVEAVIRKAKEGER